MISNSQRYVLNRHGQEDKEHPQVPMLHKVQRLTKTTIVTWENLHELAEQAKTSVDDGANGKARFV
jgi:NADH:ubiquinone oxidoreductase subunit E